MLLKSEKGNIILKFQKPYLVPVGILYQTVWSSKNKAHQEPVYIYTNI